MKCSRTLTERYSIQIFLILRPDIFQLFPVSSPVNNVPKINVAEVHIIEKSKKIDNAEIQPNKSMKISIPEILIDNADEADNEDGVEYETESNQSPCIITQPDIRFDLTDASMDEESSEDDAKKEWEWEDGEELEYEFHEQDICRPVGTSL